jgi:hypothetical protein
MQYFPMSHPILDVVGTIYFFNLERRCNVLGLNHIFFHFLQSPILSFSNTILMRVVGNEELMLNVMFSTKIYEFLIDMLPPLSMCSFLIEGYECFSTKSLKILKIGNTSLLYLRKYTQERRYKSSMKVNAYLSLEIERIGNDMRSLCTNSRGVVAHKDFPLGKGS